MNGNQKKKGTGSVGASPLSEAEIQEYIAEIQRGNDSVFGPLLKQYQSLVSSLVKQFKEKYGEHSQTESDDLRQEAVIALYQAAKRYRPGCVTFGLYAKVCMKNRMISYIRKHHHNVKPLSDLTEEIADGMNPEENLITHESFEELLEHLALSLTPHEMAVYQLYIEGLPYREIARRLQVSEKSVDNAVYRIRAKVRRILQEKKRSGNV